MVFNRKIGKVPFAKAISAILIFDLLILSVFGQIEAELPDKNSTDIATTNSSVVAPASTVIQSPSWLSIPLKICNTDDVLSKAYCKCSNNLIDCDFSDYPKKHNSTKSTTTSSSTDLATNSISKNTSQVELIVSGYQFPSNASRFCICNVPENVHLTFSKDNFLPSYPPNRIQRFDLFNLRGDTKFDGGFSQNFHGDLYIANVSFIPEILSQEFGPGDETPAMNLQDLKCCSPIKLSQKHAKPVLLIENTTIGVIHERGINDVHLWKTFIMKYVNVEDVQENGIVFGHNTGYDVAILNSKFTNASIFGLVFQDSSNLLIVKSYFKRSTHAVSLLARSKLSGSNILLLDNKIWNGIYFDIDAQNIVSWSNIHDVWDNETFHQMRFTSFTTSRSLSFKYNLVHDTILQSHTLNFGGSNVSLTKNVLGSCNCSSMKMIKDEMIKHEENYCYTGLVGIEKFTKGKCSILMSAALKECAKSGESPDFLSLCKNKKIAIEGSPPGTRLALTEDINDQALIRSNFVHLIVEDYSSTFGPNKFRIGKIVKNETGNEKGSSQNDQLSPVGENSDKSHTSKKSSKAVSIFIFLIVGGLIVVIGAITYKYRTRFRFFYRRREVHEVLEGGSQDTFI